MLQLILLFKVGFILSDACLMLFWCCSVYAILSVLSNPALNVMLSGAFLLLCRLLLFLILLRVLEPSVSFLSVVTLSVIILSAVALQLASAGAKF